MGTDGALPDLITGSAPRLHPEGVAWSPDQDRFLVGSVTRGTVSLVAPDGSVRTLVDDPALITTMGLAVARGLVFAVNGDIGIGARSSPGTVRRTAGLGVYDLGTGARVAYHDLGALDPEHAHFGNDVAIAPDGTAFVTDSQSGAVYEVPPDGAPRVLLRDDRLLPVGRVNGANGIVVHPDGFLLVAVSAGRALFRISGGVLRRVGIEEDLGAPDGLLLDPDGTLYAVDNTAANRVVALRSADGWATASLTATHPWPDPAPTTMARANDASYVLSGRLDRLQTGSDEFFLRKLPAPG